MVETEFPDVPAKSYGMNVVAEIAAKLGVEGLQVHEVAQLGEALDEQVTKLNDAGMPELPLWEPEAIKLAQQFNRKVLGMLDKNVAPRLEEALVEKARSLVVGQCVRLDEVESGDQATPTDIVPPAEIASAFGIGELFDEAEDILAAELDEWSHQTNHPSIPARLAECTTDGITRQLVEAAWQDLLGATDALDANVYLTDTLDRYHLYWASFDGRLDYATPEGYPLETQLSFDVPHNAAHLLHLHRLDAGVLGYLDRMPERAYFESVALLAEYMVTREVSSSPYFDKLASILGMSVEDTYNWIQADRSYEFKLRAARFLGDVLVSQGQSFSVAVKEVASRLQIPEEHARAEVSKYLPWLGLNAVYIKGFRKLLSRGVSTVQQAIEPRPGTVVRSWDDLDRAQLQ